eukprot:5562470-Pyramimonas_sp.AAC.1
MAEALCWKSVVGTTKSFVPVTRRAGPKPVASAHTHSARALTRTVIRQQTRTRANKTVCMASSTVSMKTYKYADLSEKERAEICQRPRIDFSSIMGIVRVQLPIF